MPLILERVLATPLYNTERGICCNWKCNIEPIYSKLAKTYIDVSDSKEEKRRNNQPTISSLGLCLSLSALPIAGSLIDQVRAYFSWNVPEIHPHYIARRVYNVSAANQNASRLVLLYYLKYNYC